MKMKMSTVPSTAPAPSKDQPKQEPNGNAKLADAEVITMQTLAATDPYPRQQYPVEPTAVHQPAPAQG